MEIELNGKKFRLGKPSARDQLKIMKRLTPILQPLVLAALAQGKKDVSITLLMSALGPTMDAFAGLPDADIDFILDTCLERVEIEMPEGAGWARVVAQGGGVMFEDALTPSTMINLSYRVLEGPMRAFFEETFQSFGERPAGAMQ